MGYYINANSKGEKLGYNKAKALIDDGAIITEAKFQDNLVCVVDNLIFEAAGYCYSEREFEDFKRDDGRRKTWLVYEHAKRLSGFTL